MQKSHLVTTRREGVRVMVRVSDPKVFEILDTVGVVLKNQIREQKQLLAHM
jgi:hypothetical protein